MKPALVVLAAGIGNRYGGLKQIDPVGPSGEIIMDYSIYDAIRAGFGRVVFVIRREIEADFKATIGDHFEGRIETAYVHQELDNVPAGFGLPPNRKKPWGTGHAILMCKDAVKAPFAVINADDFYGPSSYTVLCRYLEGLSAADGRYCLVGFVLRNTLSEHGDVARGICEVGPDGVLKTVVERTKIVKDGDGARFAGPDGQWTPLTGDERASMNMWGFAPSLFEPLERQFEEFLRTRGADLKAEFFIPTVVDRLVQEKRATVKVLETDERWFGVTYAQDKPVVVDSVRTLIDAGVYPERLWD
ncbi:MAG: nucleotidyltransferase [Kiritimatiellae bacterium]|nr:nucleotidyltransferase [Kiritimatiellia bacterium]